MAFPVSRILSTQQLIQQIIESNRNGERFCFVLGSGASVESGIPSGSTFEMRWMNCIMGKEEDYGTPPMDAAVMRECADKLYNDDQIDHSFDELEAVWQEALQNNRPIPAAYYFDIYKLRFYPNPRNGYRYLERIMETCEPSIGYRSLALMLTKKSPDNLGNNLVITTNFDSLVEDALFLYTNKKPLIVNHESLTHFIESDIQRPIVAKVHRGVMYAPFNSPETTRKLKDEWRDALNYAFSTYTPIVIGYSGGDHSLMSFLTEDTTRMRHGMYWCFRGSELPEKEIQRLVSNKGGYFVSIDGFDMVMMEMGKSIFGRDITPIFTGDYLEKQYKERLEKYLEQWNKLEKDPKMKRSLAHVNAEEENEEVRRERKNALSPYVYIRRGNRALDEGKLELAIGQFTKAIEMEPSSVTAYISRAYAYTETKEYQKAIDDCNQALGLDPLNASAYLNRGTVYFELKQYDNALRDFTEAVSLAPENATAFNNRGAAYNALEQHELALNDCTKAIDLDQNNVEAYINRGAAYGGLKQYDNAIGDYSRAIALDQNNSIAYNNRAVAYNKMKQYEYAVEDCAKAIALDANSPTPYNHRGEALSGLKEYNKAIEDYTKAIELDSQYKSAYINRAKAYRTIGKHELAEADEKNAEKL